MVIARQSTARTVMIGPVLDADGVAVTDAVVADFEISKNGADPAALNGSATLTHRNTGHYSLALTTSDLDTVGQAEIVINDATNACPVKEITVVEEAVYDALFVASAPGYLQPTTAGRTLDVASTGEAGIDFGNVLLPAGAIPALGIVDNGTAQSATSTTLVLRSAAAFADDELIGATILITGGSTGVGQTALISDYTNSTDTATISAWSGAVTPSGTITYVIFGTAPGSGGSGLDAAGVRSALGMASADLDDQLDAINNKTTNLPSDPADASVVAGLISGLDGKIDTIDNLLDTEMPALTAAVADLPTNAELATALAAADDAVLAALATVDGNVDDLKSGIIYGAAATGTLSTTQATTNLTGYADDQLIGRVVIWLTGDCAGEASDITDYANTGGLLTFTALTTAPANTDTFKIV